MKLKLIELASEGVPVLTVVAVEVELVTFTTGVPVTVKPVTVFVSQTVPPEAATVIFPVPKASVRVFELFEEKTPQVKVYVFSVIFPAVKVTAFDPVDNVALPDSDKFMSDLLMVVTAATAVDATVTVGVVPELVLKLTVSALVGGPEPPVPPDEVDQFVLLVLFQVPDPPTQ